MEDALQIFQSIVFSHATMPHTNDCNRETLARLQDFLNNPGSKYSSSEIWSDDYMEKRPWPFQTGTGREGIYQTKSNQVLTVAFVELLNEIHQAFKDYHVAMPLIISEGENVAVKMVITGTHTGIFKGIPPHLKSVRWDILAVMKIRDGLIYEQESFRDWLELMSQLQWPRRD